MSQPSPWTWSPHLQLYFWYDQQRDQYVFQDGRRVSRQALGSSVSPAMPRAVAGELRNPNETQGASLASYNRSSSLPNPQTLSTSPTERDYRSSYIPSSHDRQASSSSSTGDDSVDTIRAQLQAVSVRDTVPHQVVTNRWRTSSGIITERLDQTTNVTTQIETGPQEAITDQDLYQPGVRVHRRLLPTPNEKEKLDPSTYQ